MNPRASRIRTRHDRGLRGRQHSRMRSPRCRRARRGITGAHVDWTDSKGLNQVGAQGLELSGEQEQTQLLRPLTGYEQYARVRSLTATAAANGK